MGEWGPSSPNHAPWALPGATAATRYVGATASGAPASGTFAVGDFSVDQTGEIWVCTVAGSPGTWSNATTTGGVSNASGTAIASGTGGVSGDITFATNNVVLGAFTFAGVFTLENGAQGTDAIKILDAPAGNTLVEIENIASGGGNYAPTLIYSGVNGGISGAGGRTWSIGIDTAASTPYRDYFIGKAGGQAGGTPGAVYDVFYIAHRGSSPPTILIGNSSFTPAGAVELIMPADSSGNVTDTGLQNLRIHTALITGGNPSNQTLAAISVSNWTSAHDRFHVEADGSVNLYDSGGTGRLSLPSTSDKFGFGQDAFGQSSNTIRVKPHAVDCTVLIGTTSGGAVLVTAANGASTVTINTSNASSLALGTNSVARMTIGAAGGFTWADGSSDFIFGTATGSKIGTVGGAAGQKIGFWGATPVVQPVLATGALHTVDDVITFLQTLGLARQS